MPPKHLGEEEQQSQRWMLCKRLFCMHTHTHALACPSTHSQHLTHQSRGRDKQQELPTPYLQEIASLAVNVYEVVVYRDELLGLADEEGRTVQLGLLCSEGELPLCTQHVNAACRDRAGSCCLCLLMRETQCPLPLHGEGESEERPRTETQSVGRRGRWLSNGGCSQVWWGKMTCHSISELKTASACVHKCIKTEFLCIYPSSQLFHLPLPLETDPVRYCRWMTPNLLPSVENQF